MERVCSHLLQKQHSFACGAGSLASINVSVEGTGAPAGFSSELKRKLNRKSDAKQTTEPVS